jgi:hypothetical protein
MASGYIDAYHISYLKARARDKDNLFLCELMHFANLNLTLMSAQHQVLNHQYAQ